MPYEDLSHTADTGIEARAPDLAGLIGELAEGMFAIVASSGDEPATSTIELAVESSSNEDLVVDVLSQLLYVSEVEDVILRDIDVEETGPTAVKVRAHGVPFRDVAIAGPAIKAVTYHALEVRRFEGGWLGRVFFDV